MKFAHLADCHIGGWREPKMHEANEKAFVFAIDACIKENVDFVIIAGDLFNTAFPAIDSLRIAVQKMKELQDCKIPVYIIPGSHDSSASGKTIIDVLESAGLAINVAKGIVENEKLKLKFTVDKKTGAKITGLLGKRGGLEKEYYKQLSNDHLEQESGYKIFAFHSAIEELKSEQYSQMEAMSASLMPKNFDYYAGGHVHIVHKADIESRKNLVYPGPTFPNNFSELEKLKNGSFCIVEEGNIRDIQIIIHPVHSVQLDCEGKNPNEINLIVEKQLSGIEMHNSIITLRLSGKMREGKTTEINFNKILQLLEEKGAYFTMKNTNALTSPEFEEIKVKQGTAEEIEQEMIKEHAAQVKLIDYEKDVAVLQNLLKELALEKNEAEKIIDFEKKIVGAAESLMLANFFSVFLPKNQPLEKTNS